MKVEQNMGYFLSAQAGTSFRTRRLLNFIDFERKKDYAKSSYVNY